MDTAGESSREAPPIKQIEARTLAFGDAARIYAECTVSIEAGYIWQEYTKGSRSQIQTPCVHCGEHVAMERDNFTGWETAVTAHEAGRLGAFHCPRCGEAIDDENRRTMNAAAVLVHHGQKVEVRGRGKRRNAVIVGELPETETLGFRWNAFHNLFWTSRAIAVAEWEARRAADPDESERERRQFAWTIPVEPDAVDEIDLDAFELSQRIRPGTPRGTVPQALRVEIKRKPDDEGGEAKDLPVKRLSMGVDLRKRQLHYIAPCWAAHATAHIVQYGTLKVLSDKIGTGRAVLAALTYLRDKVIAPGFAVDGRGERIRPDAVLIDSGWQAPIIYQFLRQCEALDEWRGVFHCAAGRGWKKQYGGRYSHPAKKSRSIRLIGEQFYMVRDPEHGIRRGIVNADYWKSWLHERLATPLGEPGCLTLPVIDDGDHTELTRHWCAEKEKRIWDAEKGGEITTWETISRANHYLDATYKSCVAGYIAGVRASGPIVEEVKIDKWFANRGKR